MLKNNVMQHQYAHLAYQLFIIIGIFFLGGYCIDKYFSISFPLFSIVLSLFSLIACFITIYKKIKKE